MNKWHVYTWLKQNQAQNLTLAEITRHLKLKGFSNHDITEGVIEYLTVLSSNY